MSRLIPGEAMMAFWYHFALLFEALFILTAVDAGTRVARFMIQDLGGIFYKPFGNTDSIPANLVATFLAVTLWGYFLYTGVTDPLGGINSLWPLFGIANQMLAGVALIMYRCIGENETRSLCLGNLGSCCRRIVCNLLCRFAKLFHSDPRVSFLAHAGKYRDALASGEVLAPAKDIGEMLTNHLQRPNQCRSDRFVLVCCRDCRLYGFRTAMKARKVGWPTAKEIPAVYRDGKQPEAQNEHKLASWWKTIKLIANLMAGVPDYENYVARQRRHNPDAPVTTELQFKTTAANAVAAATADAVVN